MLTSREAAILSPLNMRRSESVGDTCLHQSHTIQSTELDVHSVFAQKRTTVTEEIASFKRGQALTAHFAFKDKGRPAPDERPTLNDQLDTFRSAIRFDSMVTSLSTRFRFARALFIFDLNSLKLANIPLSQIEL